MNLLKTGPRAHAQKFAADNRAGRTRAIRAALSAFILCLFLLAWAFRPQAALALDWVHGELWAATGLTAFLTAVMVARRRVRLRAEFAKSWLAAVPVRRRVAFVEERRLELKPTATKLVLLVALMIPLALIDGKAIVIAAYLVGALILGALLSYLIPGPKV